MKKGAPRKTIHHHLQIVNYLSQLDKSAVRAPRKHQGRDEMGAAMPPRGAEISWCRPHLLCYLLDPVTTAETSLLRRPKKRKQCCAVAADEKKGLVYRQYNQFVGFCQSGLSLSHTHTHT